jgi:hypothetical protein
MDKMMESGRIRGKGTLSSNFNVGRKEHAQ